MKFNSSVTRHILKTISWRVVGTIDTILIGTFISNDFVVGMKIGGFEVVTKMILYFLHERVWYQFKFGSDEAVADHFGISIDLVYSYRKYNQKT